MSMLASYCAARVKETDRLKALGRLRCVLCVDSIPGPLLCALPALGRSGIELT
jgi:hypothetical protein